MIKEKTNKEKMTSAEELTGAHWGYIKNVLANHSIPGPELSRIGFHYRTAMIHGYKHGYADAIKEKN